MKKVKVKLWYIVAIVVIIAFAGYLTTLPITSKEAEYIEFCETDSVVVGYQYIFLGKDSTNVAFSVFNPRYQNYLMGFKGLTYAKITDSQSAIGYWLFLRLASREVPEQPINSADIKVQVQPDWIGFIKWRDGK